MKIGFFTPGPIDARLGAVKNRIEMAKSFKELGWEAEVLGNVEVSGEKGGCYAEQLKNYLVKNAHRYDVVLYEACTLPYPRELFPGNTLFVARPALTVHHLRDVKIPKKFRWRTKFKNFMLGDPQFKRLQQELIDLEKAAHNADLVQVQNEWDRAVLVENGISADKIVVVPNGITRERRAIFDRIDGAKRTEPVVAFVGTFDFRKGAADFDTIFATIKQSVPKARLKLLGIKGMCATEKRVLWHFQKKHHKDITIVLKFEPDHLPALLEDCQIGVFPSYVESFGFGVLEMMAARLPVAAYKAPGPSMLLPEELLTERGRAAELGKNAVQLLTDGEYRRQEAEKCLAISRLYQWENIARQTQQIYAARLASHRFGGQALGDCVS